MAPRDPFEEMAFETKTGAPFDFLGAKAPVPKGDPAIRAALTVESYAMITT